MAYEKIATCCYCGTRAALVLAGTSRHELACSNCGAPLHDMKMLPTASKKAKSKPKVKERPVPLEEAAQPLGGFFAALRDSGELQKLRKKKTKSKSRKKRKGGMSRFLDEAFDVIEDIFD